MKELLLKGLSLSAQYKASPEDWVGSVNIRVFEGGFSMKPVVIVDGDIPRLEVSIEDIDEAIQYFNDEVFNVKNLRYKHVETMLNITKVNPNLDLELDDDKELYEKERQRLIKSDEHQNFLEKHQNSRP